MEKEKIDYTLLREYADTANVFDYRLLKDVRVPLQAMKNIYLKQL